MTKTALVVVASEVGTQTRPWVLVTGDFTPLGGMDRANHGLASYLARRHRGRGPPGDASRLARPDGLAGRAGPSRRTPRRVAPARAAAPRAGRARREARRLARQGGAGGRQRRQLSLGRHQLGPLRPCRLAASQTAAHSRRAKARCSHQPTWRPSAAACSRRASSSPTRSGPARR